MVNIAGTQLFCGHMKSLLLGLYLLGEVLGHMGERLIVDTVHQFCTAVEPIFIPIGGMWDGCTFTDAECAPGTGLGNL